MTETEPKHSSHAQEAHARKPKKKGVRYIPALDGLRAIAVLAVIAYHIGIPGCAGGLMGVTVFFVISGYIVTKILLVEFARTSKISFKDFYIRRIRRLVPAIILVIVATGALCTLFNHVLLTKMRPEVLPSLFFVNNWWQILNDASYFENLGLPSPLTHFWSLAIEEQFYLVLPMTLFLVLRFGGRLSQRRNLACFMLILAAASALEMGLLYDPSTDPTRVYYGTDTRAFSLFIGAFVAVVSTGNKKRLAKGIRRAFAIIGLVGVLICLSIMGGEEAFTYRGGMVACSVLTAMLIYGTLWEDTGAIARVLGTAPFLWVGKRSYGIYLWHYPLVLLFTNMNGNEGMELIGMAAAVICTFACAELSFRFVENPIRYGISLSKEKAAKASAAPKHSGSPVTSGPIQSDIVEGLLSVPDEKSIAGDLSEGEGYDMDEAQGDGSGDAEKQASRAKRRPQLLSIPTYIVIACLAAVALFGFAFVDDESALSDDGAAILLRGSMPGEPYNQEVQLATGDDEIPVISLDEEEDDGEEKPVYDILMIGDSVSLRAVPYFEERFPYGHIDSEKNRRIDQGIEVYKEYAEDGQVGDIVIFSLGTNGHLTEESLREAVETVGSDKQIYFITVRSADSDLANENNTAINQIVSEYSNVHLIDWNSLSASHGDYFDGDGTHLTDSAAKTYIQFIADVLQYPTAEQQQAERSEQD
ncbi:MAG: acyltransferase [Eggerthellaceae bacterium]|nr:acyltransferase [Eggerthellaceae bacterium]